MKLNASPPLQIQIVAVHAQPPPIDRADQTWEIIPTHHPYGRRPSPPPAWRLVKKLNCAVIGPTTSDLVDDEPNI